VMVVEEDEEQATAKTGSKMLSSTSRMSTYSSRKIQIWRYINCLI